MSYAKSILLVERDKLSKEKIRIKSVHEKLNQNPCTQNKLAIEELDRRIVDLTNAISIISKYSLATK